MGISDRSGHDWTAGSGTDVGVGRGATYGAEPRLAGRGQNDDRNGGGSVGGGTDVVTKTSPKTKKPSMYRVLLLNDDYTPMEFVVHVLERYFNKDQQEATQIMLHVHQKGIGVCGIFPFEIAETKVMQVTDLARKNQHPLQCTMEKI
ncbi:MAG: ATP-dependent Clp protease adapter ClpS [Rhodospirillaceae bacterium]|jgi:ATP-dependent Clp protease adaptor protein ClpS|nr:ATP-dependent Clp protease adapter ClpS [Rhodospirillaceae bacterium]|tara:strand:- start:1378 stop:1818 length:441 start_codon:yes stop_codon:yes gene_type:complete